MTPALPVPLSLNWPGVEMWRTMVAVVQLVALALCRTAKNLQENILGQQTRQVFARISGGRGGGNGFDHWSSFAPPVHGNFKFIAGFATYSYASV